MVILCFALNKFVSIITDAFDELQREFKQKPKDFDLINFAHLWVVIRLVSKQDSSPNEQSSPSPGTYVDKLDLIQSYTERLIQFIFRVV